MLLHGPSRFLRHARNCLSASITGVCPLQITVSQLVSAQQDPVSRLSLSARFSDVSLHVAACLSFKVSSEEPWGIVTSYHDSPSKTRGTCSPLFLHGQWVPSPGHSFVPGCYLSVSDKKLRCPREIVTSYHYHDRPAGNMPQTWALSVKWPATIIMTAQQETCLSPCLKHQLCQ